MNEKRGVISRKSYVLKTLARVEILLSLVVYPMGLFIGIKSEQFFSLTVALLLMGMLLALLASTINYNKFVKPLNLLVEYINSLYKNDLSYRIDLTLTSGHREIFGMLNSATDNLEEIMKRIKFSASTFIEKLDEIEDIVTRITDTTKEQLESIDTTFNSLNFLTAAVISNEKNAGQADKDAELTMTAVIKGDEAVNETLKAMEDANISSKRIIDIISIVNEIAFQTNLLALNAAVEAARAGEHGRGFAVVAGEVRNLAQRSAAASNEVKQLVNDTVEKISAGNSLVMKTADSLNVITEHAKKISSEISGVNKASKEQSAGLDSVTSSVWKIHDTALNNIEIAQKAVKLDDDVKNMAQTLYKQVSDFDVGLDKLRDN